MKKIQITPPAVLTCFGILIYSAWLLGSVLNPHLSQSQSYVSELSVSGQPYASYFQAANLVGSVFMFTGFLLFLRKSSRFTTKSRLFLKLLTVISAIGIINALFPMNCAPSQSHECLLAQERFEFSLSQWIHVLSAITMFSGLIVAQSMSTFYLLKKHSTAYWFGLANVSVQLFLNTVIAIICLLGFSNVGIFQRISLALFCLWLITLVYRFDALTGSL